MLFVIRIQFKDIIQCYSKVIEFLKLGIIFGKYIFMVSNEVEDPLRLYFVYFLNLLPLYEEIQCLISSYKDSNNLNFTLSSSCWKLFIIYARCKVFLSCFYKTRNFLLIVILMINWITMQIVVQLDRPTSEIWTPTKLNFFIAFL